MSFNSPDAPHESLPTWGLIWREWPLWACVALSLVCYGVHPTLLPVRGEESRRGLIAREMLETGDWIVPRTQGEPLLSRPPLQNWVIAACSLPTGRVDLWAVRLPSVIAMLLTTMLLYAYARHGLTPTGAGAAAGMFATMFQVMELGRVGETEAFFTLLVSASLFLWHIGQMRAWRPAAGWLVPLAIVGLAVLAKGPQPPVYFAAATTLYLIVQRRMRALCSAWHAAGWCVCGAIVLAWQIPFWQAVGTKAALVMWIGDVAMRFDDNRWLRFFTHLATFPAELFLGCMAPWSFLLLGWLDRRVRSVNGRTRELAVFCGLCAGFSFLTVWFPPGSRPRYYMPIYPCFAVLIGIVIDRLSLDAEAVYGRRVWRNVAGVVTVVCFIAPCVWTVAGAGLIPSMALTSPAWGVGLLASAVAAAAWLRRTRDVAGTMLPTVLALSFGLALNYSGPIVELMSMKSCRSEEATTAALAEVPNDVPLVSFGPAMHVFLFHSPRTVPMLPLPLTEAEIPDDVEYFCWTRTEAGGPNLPFEWERVASIPCDRWARATPKEEVIIGRRKGASVGSPTRTSSRKASLGGKSKSS